MFHFVRLDSFYLHWEVRVVNGELLCQVEFIRHHNGRERCRSIMGWLGLVTLRILVLVSLILQHHRVLVGNCETFSYLFVVALPGLDVESSVRCVTVLQVCDVDLLRGYCRFCDVDRFYCDLIVDVLLHSCGRHTSRRAIWCGGSISAPCGRVKIIRFHHDSFYFICF